MALTLVADSTVRVELAGEALVPRSGWPRSVGQLYLLDADVEDNSEGMRAVTTGCTGRTEHRIRQESPRIGGVRALDAVGAETQVFHTMRAMPAFSASSGSACW